MLFRYPKNSKPFIFVFLVIYLLYLCVNLICWSLSNTQFSERHIAIIMVSTYTGICPHRYYEFHCKRHFNNHINFAPYCSAFSLSSVEFSGLHDIQHFFCDIHTESN